MSFMFYLSNLPFEFAVDVCSLTNRILKRRPSSAPFLAGDTYRNIADFLYDETFQCSADDINAFSKSKKNIKRKNPVVFISSWLLDNFTKEVLPFVKKQFVLITHQGDLNITQTPKFQEIANNPMILHWFAQNCALANDKVTPLPIGLEDRWRHNAGAIADFKHKKYKNNQKRKRILFGFAINTNPDKRIPCYLAFVKAKNAQLIYRSPSCHLYRRKLSKYMFVASPEGNGLDCHRTWEAMYLNVIPIVNNNPMNRYFASLGLPMICTDDWTIWANYSEEQLEKEYKALINTANKKPLRFSFWTEQIEKITEEIKC